MARQSIYASVFQDFHKYHSRLNVRKFNSDNLVRFIEYIKVESNYYE